MSNAQQEGRRTLIIISLLFISPIIIAVYMYFGGSSWVPGTSTEHGELIKPPRTLPDTPIRGQDDQFRKIWSLVVVADKSCDADCITALEHIRQIRLSLGPKMTRMQTVFLPASETAIAPVLLNGEHPKLIVVPPEVNGEFREIIGPYENAEIFMVDPLGNLMMRYAPGTGMGDIRKDIAHLYKLSGIG